MMNGETLQKRAGSPAVTPAEIQSANDSQKAQETNNHFIAARHLKAACGCCEHQKAEWCTLNQPKIVNAAHCVLAAFTVLQNLISLDTWTVVETKTDRIIAPTQSESVITHRQVIFHPGDTAQILTRSIAECQLSERELREGGW